MNDKPMDRKQRSEIGGCMPFISCLFRALMAMTLIAVAIGAMSAHAAGNVLKEMSFSSLPGGAVRIVLIAENVLDPPKLFTTDNPARIALDFFDMSNGLVRKTQSVGIGVARSVTAVEAGGRTRVVINLVASASHDIQVEGNRVMVIIDGGDQSAQQQAASGTLTSSFASASAVTPATNGSIRNVDFRRGDSGEGRLIIELGDPSNIVDMRTEGGRIVLEIMNTSLPERLMRKFDVSDFTTPVKSFEVSSRGRNVHVGITTTGEYEYFAFQADKLYTVEFRPLTKAEKQGLLDRKKMFTGKRLSLNFQDIKVRTVLQLLADFTDINLVTSGTVRGRITLRLRNVPWDQVLDIILKTHGLSKRVKGSVMLIAPTEELVARERLELESQQQIDELAPLHSEFMQINYAKARDIRRLLKSEDNQLLTPGRGNVAVDKRTNTLLVQDTAARLEDIRRLIVGLDVPVRQVLIESRVVVANNDFARDIGVRFGVNTELKLGGGNSVSLGGGLQGNLAGSFGKAPGVENPAGSTKEALLVNLPQTLSAERGGALNLVLGKLGSYLLQLELSAMQQEGRGEVISSPRVITSDQHTAIIKQGIEIPYQEASSSGATSVSFKEAVLKLEVTPHITPDDSIMMDLVINKDNPDFGRSILGVPPVATREIETTVLVDNGATVVLGGIFEQTENNKREQIPFFGDLPYVGFLFKQEMTKNKHTELLVFVTPKILKGSLRRGL